MLFPWFQEWKSLVISESWSLPMRLSPELYFFSPTPGWWRGGHGKNKANISKAWLHYLKISKQRDTNSEKCATFTTEFNVLFFRSSEIRKLMGFESHGAAAFICGLSWTCGLVSPEKVQELI